MFRRRGLNHTSSKSQSSNFKPEGEELNFDAYMFLLYFHIYFMEGKHPYTYLSLALLQLCSILQIKKAARETRGRGDCV